MNAVQSINKILVEKGLSDDSDENKYLNARQMMFMSQSARILKLVDSVDFVNEGVHLLSSGISPFLGFSVKPTSGYHTLSLLGFHSAILNHPRTFGWDKVIRLKKDSEFSRIVSQLPDKMIISAVVLGFCLGSHKVGAYFNSSSAVHIDDVRLVLERVDSVLVSQLLNELFNTVPTKTALEAGLSFAILLHESGNKEMASEMFGHPFILGLPLIDREEAVLSMQESIFVVDPDLSSRFIEQYLEYPCFLDITKSRVSKKIQSLGRFFTLGQDISQPALEIAKNYPIQVLDRNTLAVWSCFEFLRNTDVSNFFVSKIDLDGMTSDELMDMLKPLRNPIALVAAMKTKPDLLSTAFDVFYATDKYYASDSANFLEAVSSLSRAPGILVGQEPSRLFARMAAAVKALAGTSIGADAHLPYRSVFVMVSRFMASLVNKDFEPKLVQDFCEIINRPDLLGAFLGASGDHRMMATKIKREHLRMLSNSSFDL